MATGVTDLRKGWFCDHAPGRAKLITGNGSLVGTKGKYYFEVKVVASTSGSKVCIGIANSTFNLENHQPLDLAAGSYAALNGGCFISVGNTGAVVNGWGGTGTPPSVGFTVATGDWVGVAVDTNTGFAWWRNATQAPAAWSGGSGVLTPDPVAEVQGYAYDANATMSGDVYVLVGGGNEGTTPLPSGLCNFGGSAFAASAPTGYSPWNASDTLNPADVATEFVLSSLNLGYQVGIITPNANQYSAYGRTQGHKASV